MEAGEEAVRKQAANRDTERDPFAAITVASGADVDRMLEPERDDDVLF